MLGLRMYKDEILIKELISRFTYPKQSPKNYPYKLEIRDNYSRSRSSSEPVFEHQILLSLNCKSEDKKIQKKYNYSTKEYIETDEKMDLSNIIAKELYDLIEGKLKRVMGENPGYILNLNRNQININRLG